MRVLDGNAGKRPINDLEPLPVGKLEDRPPPSGLSEAQKEIWREAINGAPPGMLRDLDESCLEVWVVARFHHRKASAEVTRLGALVKGKEEGSQPYQNPYLPIMNKQAQIMLKAAAELGFTPSSRSRVKVDAPKAPGAGNPFSDLKSLTD